MAEKRHYEGTVSRDQLKVAVEALGLNPENTVSINMTADRVRVIEYVRDENGARIINEAFEGFDRRCYTLQVK